MQIMYFPLQYFETICYRIFVCKGRGLLAHVRGLMLGEDFWMFGKDRKMTSPPNFDVIRNQMAHRVVVRSKLVRLIV